MTTDEKLDKVLCFMDNLQQRKTTLKVENTELRKSIELEKDKVKKLQTTIENKDSEKRGLEATLGRLRTYMRDFGITEPKEKNGRKSVGELNATIVEQGKVINERNQTIKELRAEIEHLKSSVVEVQGVV